MLCFKKLIKKKENWLSILNSNIRRVNVSLLRKESLMQNILEWLKDKKILVSFILMTFVTLGSLVLYVTNVMAEETYTCPKTEETVSTDEEKSEIVVDIKGAVVNPGVYKVVKESIVNDLIQMAGGLTKDADTSNLNLSKTLTNEMVVTVYTKDEVKNMAKLDSVTESTESTSNDKTTTDQASSLININTASLSELQNIPGVGEAKAKLIIDYRTNCGKFTKKEDIKNIKGIGDKMYEKMAPYLTV